MKASEMKNEVLAKNAEEFANAFHNESDKAILREAAARLRNVTVRSDNSAVIAELQRRLKVAEDALVKIARFDNDHFAVDGGALVQIAKNALAAIRSDNSKVVADLLAKLKVAEDALAKLQDRFVSSVHDGTIDPYEALKIAEDALAAIRELESVKTKPIRNCDRFETAEDAYNACPQFCDIDVKTMTERELKIIEATTKCLEWLFAPIAEKGVAK